MNQRLTRPWPASRETNVKNAVMDRARIALAKARPEPVIDNVPEGALTAHAVRRLRPCVHCVGIGDHQQMILSAAGQHYHTGCYVAAVGFAAVLRLPPAERGKFRLCDLSVQQWRKLLKVRP